MISRVKTKRDRTLWHDWFAWYPVRIEAGKMYVWVWWQTIERKFHYSYDGCIIEYRMKKP